MSGGSLGTTFRLNEPGMHEYERTGLAGLYLSLTAVKLWELEQQVWPLSEDVRESLVELQGAVSFSLTEDGLGIRLEWPEGSEQVALRAILKWAWQVRVHDGVLFIPGIHRKREHLSRYYLRLHAHNGILGTFFQHPRVVGRAKGGERKVERFDEGMSFTVSYQRIAPETVLPQHTSSGAVPRLLKQGVCSDAPAPPLPSWVYPGSAPSFNNSKARVRLEEPWVGPARFAYLMLFVPIACYYTKLPHSSGGPDWAYTIPAVRNLREFQREFLRRGVVNLNNWPFYSEVAGLEDATLRYAIRNKEASQSLTTVMGKVNYYRQQKTRKNLWRDLAMADDMPTAGSRGTMFRRYDIFNRIFPVGNTARPAREAKVGEEKGSHFVALPSCRERITANIFHGSSWYSRLAFIPPWQQEQMRNGCQDVRKRGLQAVGLHFPWKSSDEGESISPERLWFLKLHHQERGGLVKIAEEQGMWHDPREGELLDAFTQMFRRLLNREHKAKERGGERDLRKRWDDMAAEWHRRLLHAKTKRLLSRAVNELLSQAARSPYLRRGKGEDDDSFEPGGPAFLLKAGADESDESRRDRSKAFLAKFRRMMDHHRDWEKVRDLAILALAIFSDSRLSSKGKQSANKEAKQ